MDIGADQNGLAVLEDLVEAGDADVGEILLEVVGTRLVDGVMHDVVHRAGRHVEAEDVAIKFVNAAIRTVADEGQTEGGLLEPILGVGQMEKHLVVGDGGREGVVQSGLSAVGLPSSGMASWSGASRAADSVFPAIDRLVLRINYPGQCKP